MKKYTQEQTIIFQSKKNPIAIVCCKHQSSRKVKKSKFKVKASAKTKAEKEYKDTVFTKLFNNKATARWHDY